MVAGRCRTAHLHEFMECVPSLAHGIGREYHGTCWGKIGKASNTKSGQFDR